MDNKRFQGVMGRMEWFRDLKTIFDKLHSKAHFAILKSKFLQEMHEYPFQLDAPEEYYERHSTIALSFQEIVKAVQSISCSRVTLDQIIDSVIQIPAHKEAVSSQSNQLEIAYPEEKLLEFPVSLIHSSLEYLSLAGNALTSANWEFPVSLVVLNLAGNEIKVASFESALPNLKLINLSNNRMIDLSFANALKNLREVFIGYNSLKAIGNIHSLPKLRILDCSYNDISSVDAISDLSSLPQLQAIKLKGNPLSFTDDYNLVMNRVFVCEIDPLNIIDKSEFKMEYLPFLPLKRPPRQTQRRGIATPDVKSDDFTPVRPYNEARTPASVMSSLNWDFNSVIDLADERIPTREKSTKRGIKTFVVTKQEILHSESKFYDNPVKAVMISPPVNKCAKIKFSSVKINRRRKK